MPETAVATVGAPAPKADGKPAAEAEQGFSMYRALKELPEIFRIYDQNHRWFIDHKREVGEAYDRKFVAVWGNRVVASTGEPSEMRSLLPPEVDRRAVFYAYVSADDPE